MGKEESKKDLRLKYTLINSEQHPNKYYIGKRQAMIAYMGVGLKKFTSIHDILAIKMNRCLQEIDTLEYLTKGKITLIQKGAKERTTINYRPIMCLPMMWKTPTTQKRE